MASKGNELIKYARSLGYEFKRQAHGSHQIYQHPITGVSMTVPVSGKRHERSIQNIKSNLRRGASGQV